MTRPRFPCRAAVLLLALGASPAAANDSTATLGAGGLELTRSESIELRSEDLAISREQVAIRYEFFNKSGREVRTLVAFPLPAVDLGDHADIDINTPSDDPVNFVGFAVKVDGRPVTPRVEVKAERNGRDVTQVLKDSKVPVSAFAPALIDALWALPKAQQRALSDAGLVEYQHEYNAVRPLWTARITYFWEMAFPPGRATVVEHTYAPVYGTQFVGAWTLDDPSEDERKWLARYCVDNAMRTDLRNRMDAGAQAGEPAYLLADTIAYILTTARNWHGPIGRFRITLDSGHPDNLLATCLPGIRKAGATTWTLERRNYVPKGELDVLIVRGEPTQ